MPTKAKYVEADFLGDLEPLRSNVAKAVMDRRNISYKWLGGSVLTGLASIFLMGGALYAALDGRQQLAIPAQAYNKQDDGELARKIAVKGTKPGPTLQDADSGDSNLMMVSTISKEGEQNVVKLRPFLHVTTPLAILPKKEIAYPRFDPLSIYADTNEPEVEIESSDLIYGAQVEGELALQTIDFPFGDPKIQLASLQSTKDIEPLVRNTAPNLSLGATAVTAITYFDPTRFSSEDALFANTPGLSITAENVSILQQKLPEEYIGVRYAERLARIRNDAPIELILQGEGLDDQKAKKFASALASNLTSKNLLRDDRLRMNFEIDTSAGETKEKMSRISVYRGGEHLVSVVEKDDGDLVYASVPDDRPNFSTTSASSPQIARSNLPNIYDAVFKASMNEGLPLTLAQQLIKMLAFDVDFKTTVSSNDKIDLLLSLEDGETTPSETSEIIYASLKLGSVERDYYRFRDDETGKIDYYDETGKSSKQFLLRQTVPNGEFRSPFGMRRHPVTRVYKMHTGVDWSAPRGTPIIASGNGVVEKAGWAGGYGKQTVIRHANGYETSYNHQSGFAKGIQPGARVRQGQVIGYVGSTGLSTGPHLHFEVLVNGNRVDPMRIKLPQGKVFKGKQLQDFQAERDRIDNLLRDRNEANQRLARS